MCSTLAIPATPTQPSHVVSISFSARFALVLLHGNAGSSDAFSYATFGVHLISAYFAHMPDYGHAARHSADYARGVSSIFKTLSWSWSI